MTPKSAASSFGSCSSSTGGQTVGVIKEEPLEIHHSKIQVLDYIDKSTIYSPEESLTRARKRLMEMEYNVVSRNCEHLVNWAITGKAQSAQSDTGIIITMKCP